MISLPPPVDLTSLAINKALELQKDFPRYRNLPLRIYIEGKSCDGFTYGVTFDEPTDDDIHFKCEALACVIDKESLIFCKGSTIHWVDDERGTGFLVENPNQRKYRGKFYKRSEWQTYFEKVSQKNKS